MLLGMSALNWDLYFDRISVFYSGSSLDFFVVLQKASAIAYLLARFPFPIEQNKTKTLLSLK